MLDTQTSLGDKIKKIYSAIKNNDLELFKSHYREDPRIIYLKNSNQNTLLFYCLEKQSLSIFNFVLSKNKKMLLEQNIYGENCLTYLINKNEMKSLTHFLDNTTDKIKESLSLQIDNRGNDLIGVSILQGAAYFELCKKHFPKDVSHVNFENQNLSHIIAMKNASYAVDYLERENFDFLDHKGISPFLMACRYSDTELFKIFATQSNIFLQSPLQSSALHFCAYSGNVEKLDYLLKSGLNPNSTNSYEHTPLSISLVEKQYLFAYELIKKVDKITFDDLLYIVRVCDKAPFLFDYVMAQKEMLTSLLDSEEKTAKFLSHVYYYTTEDKLAANQPYFCEITPNDKKLVNTLYFASIAGRRDFLYKTNYLTDTFGWSQIDGNTFHNFSKDYPCGFIYSLNQLPKTQFDNLLYNSHVIESLSNLDSIVFKILSINKNSDIHQIVDSELDFSPIKNDKNIAYLLQKTTSSKFSKHLEFFEGLSINSDVCETVTQNIAQCIYSHDTPLEEFKRVYQKIKTNKFKKDIYIKLNELLLKDNAPHHLEIIFKNKYAIMENVLNKMLVETPQSFNNLKYLSGVSLNIAPESCFSYLKNHEFNKKSFFLIYKSSGFFTSLKDRDLKSEQGLAELFKETMSHCHRNDKLALFNKFLEYSSRNKDISHHSYNYHFNQFSESEQKYIIKSSLISYLENSGDNKEIYQYIEKKYLNFFSATSLRKNILKYADIDFLIDKSNSEPEFNMFSSKAFNLKNSIAMVESLNFNEMVDKCVLKCVDFSKNALKDFLRSSKTPITELLKVVKIDTSCHADHYIKVMDRVLSEISQDKSHGPVTDILEEMLFNKSDEIKKMVIENEEIYNSNYLSVNQRSYIFSQKLNNTLEEKTVKIKKVKI